MSRSAGTNSSRSSWRQKEPSELLFDVRQLVIWPDEFIESARRRIQCPLSAISPFKSYICSIFVNKRVVIAIRLEAGITNDYSVVVDASGAAECPAQSAEIAKVAVPVEERVLVRITFGFRIAYHVARLIYCPRMAVSTPEGGQGVAGLERRSAASIVQESSRNPRSEVRPPNYLVRVVDVLT